MTIGKNIADLRKNSGMTQEQLAEYIGITANAVSQWECDKTSPDISQLPTLANLFEVTTDYLLGKDDQKEADILREKRNHGFPESTHFLLQLLLFLWKKCEVDGAYVLAYEQIANPEPVEIAE